MRQLSGSKRSLFWGLLVAVTAGCGGAPHGEVPFGTGLPAAPATPELSALERQMFERVNRDRAQNQLPPLSFDRTLSDIARSHSTDMRDNHFFEHESPRFGLLQARLNRAGYVFITSRENLAEAPTVDSAEDGLLKSPHHFENLMAKDITLVGIGIVKGGVKDPRNLTVTQIFATPGRRESDTEALSAIDKAIGQARQSNGRPALSRHPRLDALAKEQLAGISGELDRGRLKEVGVKAAEAMAKAPIAGVTRISVGAQVVVDSTQFLPEGAAVAEDARAYGLAVDHGARADAGGGAPRLRVLLLVGLR